MTDLHASLEASIENVAHLVRQELAGRVPPSDAGAVTSQDESAGVVEMLVATVTAPVAMATLPCWVRVADYPDSV